MIPQMSKANGPLVHNHVIRACLRVPLADALASIEAPSSRYTEVTEGGVVLVTPDMIRDGRAIDWLDRALRV